jgi:methylmalonyl-CoA/ethylmalonyl-CoA epimerase
LLSSFSFHHIGIATHSIKETAQYYIDVGYSMSEVMYDKNQNVYITFMEKLSSPRIELLEPYSDKYPPPLGFTEVSDSPVSRILKKSGVSPYHICYEVENIIEAIKNLKNKRYVLLSHPVEAIALKRKLICFLYNRAVGLIELVEK